MQKFDAWTIALKSELKIALFETFIIGNNWSFYGNYFKLRFKPNFTGVWLTFNEENPVIAYLCRKSISIEVFSTAPKLYLLAKTFHTGTHINGEKV